SKTSARIYPAYHTAYDTFDYTANHIDPGFFSHQAVGRTAGNVLIRLADSLILPLGPRDYSETLETYYNTADSTFSAELTARKISLDPVKKAIDRYKMYSEELNKIISELKKQEQDHVIWASRSSSVVTFPGIADAFSKASSTGLEEDWKQVHHHITVAATAIDNAASTLQAAASI
ncbi:hypothetical protein AB205_0078400, partial [Aquarana catesbeiana]